MRKQHIIHFGWLLLVLSLVLAACGGRADDDVLPTTVPTAVSPTTDSATTNNTSDDGIAAAEPTKPAPTAVPIPAVDPADIDWPPQLVYSSPQPGEPVRLDGAITLRFDQPMDQASVEAAFTIEPAVEGEFTWERPDTVIFTPRVKLDRRQNYKVRVERTATGLNGRTLPELIELDLATVGGLTVSQVIPAADSNAVETDSSITVIFNRPVVPLTPTNQQAKLPQPLAITPALAGHGEWVSTSIYRFVADTGLAGGTTYAVAIAAGLEDVVGATLEADYEWQFTTERPTVFSVEPELQERPLNLTQPITITFNMPMDTAATAAAIALRSDAGNAPFTAAWSNNDQTVALTPDGNLPIGTVFQLAIGAGATSASGGATFAEEAVYGFRTVPLPAVINTQPSSGATAERWQSGFTIFFASPMNLDTVEGRLQIDPPPAKEPEYYFNEYDNSLYVGFPLQGNSDYTVTVPGDAADPYGNTLGQPYTWRFRTPNLAAVASFNLPQQVSQLSTSFPSTVELIHRNIAAYDVALYNLGLPLNLINESYTIYDYNPATAPDRTFSAALDTPDGEVGIASIPLADGGVLPTGVYLVVATAPDLPEDSRYWQNQRNLLIVGDTNIVVKEMFDTVHVWVTDIASGQPAAGRNLTLYSQRGAELATAVSDSSGFASFPYEPSEPYLEGVTVVSEQPGAIGFGVARSQWTGNISIWQLGIQQDSGREAPLFAYIYTDRPIYRPGDTVYFKGIVRQPNYGRYRPPTAETVTVHLNTAFYDPNGGLDEQFELPVNADGSFNGEYVLPENAQLGNFQLWLDLNTPDGYRQFAVAEYRKPEFQVTLTPDKAETLRGESVDVDLLAEFFFGGTASDLQVNWTAYETSYQPNVPGPFYAFGDYGGYYYEDNFFFGGSVPLGNYVANGEGKTDANGRFTINLPADFLENADAGSRRVTVEATLSDISNFPVSARTEVIFHAADGYVGIIPTDYVAVAGTKAEVQLVTVDWSGQPLPNQNVEVVFYQREWKSQRDTSFGIYRTVWEPVDTEVDRASVTTDNVGKAVASFVPEEGGSYIALATLTDSGGREAVSSTNIWAIDPAYGGWRSDPTQKSMELLPDKQAYKVGDTARLLVQSPFTEPVNAWLTIERGELIEQRVVRLNGSSELLDIPIDPLFAPNVHVEVTAVKPVTPGSDFPYADVRFGLAELKVSTEQLALNVELIPQQELFVPGETAVYDIRVTNYLGQPVQADLSLALVDLAVLTLMPDNAPPIVEAFYKPQPLRSQTGGSLFISGEGLEPEIPLEGGGFGGGGGGDEARSAVALEEEDEARREFPDTAYWAATISTNADGTATVEIPLPDSLTTWRLSSKAATADSLVGQSAVDVVVSLPLLVRPVTPRFFTVGDVVTLGAIVNNNTGDALETAVTLQATGLTLNDEATQTVTVPANGRQLVQWQVVVEDVESADLTFRVAGGDYRDASKPTLGVGPNQLIPVYRYTGQDVVGTAGVLDEADRRVEAILLPDGVDLRQGSIDATLSPSLAAALLDSLKAIERRDYDSECAHSVAYRLIPNVATAVALRELDLNSSLLTQLDTLVPSDIDQIGQLAMPNGGWGWCYTRERDPFLTSHILLALLKAEQAGYTVPSQVMDDAVNYLAGLTTPARAENLTAPWEINRWAFYVYVLSEANYDVDAVRDALFAKQRVRLSPSAEALLALSYELGSPDAATQATLLDDLNTNAVVSATGTNWQDDDPEAWQHLGSDVAETAVVINALTQLDPQNELLPGAIRWLMNARTLAYWPTEYETAWSVEALASWLLVSGELEADYDYLLNVNLDTTAEGHFSPARVTESEAISVPLNKLVANDVNFFDVQRGSGNGRLYYTLHLNAALDVSTISPLDRGLSIQRTYYDAACDPETAVCQPIDHIAAGQQVRVVLDITVPNNLSYAIVEDPLPAGAEAIDPNLATSQSGEGPTITNQQYEYGYWGYWFFNRIEFRDEKVVFHAGFLPAGSYQYSYTLQTNIPGSYQVRPAFGYQEFFPEVNGRSGGFVFEITK